MKYEKVYIILIYFFTFTCFKKFVDVIGEINVPTYESRKTVSPFWQKFVNFRTFLNFLSLIIKLCILYFYKLNGYLISIFVILILSNIFYFVIENRYIYYLIPKEKLNTNFLNYLDRYGGIYENLFEFLFLFYIIINIYNFDK